MLEPFYLIYSSSINLLLQKSVNIQDRSRGQFVDVEIISFLATIRIRNVQWATIKGHDASAALFSQAKFYGNMTYIFELLRPLAFDTKKV